MKKIVLLVALLFTACAGKIFAQVTLNLSGYPIVTTGWTIGGTAFAVDSEIQLTTSAGSETGYVYYNTSENVTACGSFTVDFDYKITAAGGCGLADGIAFYFINPMTSFVTGGGLGLPNPLTGFVFTMDTWDNDGDGLNPEHQLFGYTGPATYSEADVTHRLAPTLGPESWMGDGSWHHVHITYNGGVIRVYLNGSTTVSMTGTFPITTAGYFGFSGSTGCGYSSQYVKSVSVVSNTISPISGVTTVCQGSTTNLYDSTSGGTWTSGSTGVATVGATTGVVTGVTTGTAVITYTYNTGACSATTTVTVVTPPAPIAGAASICSGSTTTLTDATSGGAWTSGNPLVASIGSTSGIVNGLSVGTVTITYSTGGACYVTATLNVTPMPGAISGAPTVCTGAGITLTDPVPGGTWTSGSTGIATVGATTGIVTGTGAGIVTVSYSIGACFVTKAVTVNPSPAAITGTTSVCIGYTATLADGTPGGTWSSSNPSVAAVGSSTGVVSGVAAGVVSISYTLPGGCFTTALFTVNALPGFITGIPYVCVGLTSSLYCAGGGAWSSANPAIATVGSSTGVVTGVAAGSVVISYILPTGCYTTASVAVAPLPGAINGSLSLCMGSTDTLSDTTVGGLWSSSNPSVAFIDAISGIVTGIAPGVVTITYTASFGSGCPVSTTLTVNPLPGPITGSPTVCVGATTTLVDAGGGTWTSASPSVAAIGSSSGVVSGISAGYSIISYTLPAGCVTAIFVTVNPSPLPIAGPATVCSGSTATVTCGSPGGTWAIVPATFGSISSSGVVTGLGVGCATIIYTIPTGCSASAPICITGSPAPVSGTLQVCVGAATPLTDITTGGTWTIAPTSVATISSSGVVTGVSAGLATVTYAVGVGCIATAVVTVNPLPSVIAGPSALCQGSTITLTSSAGITWSSSATGIAAIGSSSGVVTGIGPGVVTITGSLPLTGCSRTKTITVNPLPAPISGLSTVCAGATILLNDATGGGTWNSVPATIATVGATTGIVTGVAPGIATISYTIGGTGCSITRLVTVNGLPPACTVTGGGGFCTGGAGVHVGLSCSTTGITYQLFSSGSSIGTPLAGTGTALDFGLQTAAGTYTVVATNSTTGCFATMPGSAAVTVNLPPSAIGGPSALCIGASIPLSSSPGGGVWVSGSTSVATIGSSTGVLTGVTTGATVVTYTLSSGCSTTKAVTVSLSPGPILGPGFACTGTTITTLTNSVPGGLWSSGTPAVATIGSLSGIVTGGSITGTTLITYSLGTGCTVTRTLTVSGSPAGILGALGICQGTTTTLSDATTGGTWASSAPSVASVVPATGFVNALSAGTATIAYTVPSGCSASAVLTVNSLPGPISGAPVLCAGGATALTDAVPGGTWTSGTISVATIGASTGIVAGVTAGTSVITYSIGIGCTVTKVVTVNPVPSAVTGTPHVCVGLSTTLADATPGGAWSHTTPFVASLSGSVVTGMSGGVDTVLYALPVTGCAAKLAVTVNPVPTPISGPSGVCVGQTIVLTDGVPGGAWTSANPAVATIGSSSGVVTGVSFGSTSVTYSAGGCYITGTVNVISSPMGITGPTNVCVGQTITLSDASPGGVWSSGIPSQASAGSSSGVVTGISSGTVIISYTLGTTGCTAVQAVVVNPVSPILGNPAVCVGQTTTLHDTTLGGTWSSSLLPVATAGPGGVVTGVSAGASVVTYLLPATGCAATVTVTVNSLPPAISGPGVVCVGQTILETDAATGGTWSSGSPAVATAGSATGAVTGVTYGIAAISFSLPVTGCAATTVITVNALPAGIGGPDQVCVGGTVPLSDVSPGGTWTSSTPSVATVNAGTGLVSGISSGAATVSYTLSSGCWVTKSVTVNPSVPALTGPAAYCVGAIVALSSGMPGGTWSSSNPGVVSAGLLCTGPGTSTISYTLGAGCVASAVVTVNNPPSAIAGAVSVCQGSSTALSDPTPGGNWSSSDATIASIGSGSGTVSGVAPGTAIITYTAGSGCAVTSSIVVSALPSPIAGATAVCGVGASTTLTDLTAGGAWSSANPGVASVSTSGIVTGISAGSATISYTVGATGCAATQPITVVTLPIGLTGLVNICQGATTTLVATPSGGTWSSGSPGVATITPVSGVVTGVITGAGAPAPATFYYTFGGGCTSVATSYVNPLPAAITGPGTVCAGQAVTLTDPGTGGTWSSSTPALGSVDAAGNVTGISAGTLTISYTNIYACSATFPVTVNAMPAPVGGPASVCLGGTAALSDAVGGGSWWSNNPLIASVGSTTGIVTGVALGSTTIVYQLPPSGSCFVSKLVNVYPPPPVFSVTGGGNRCAGDTGVHIGLSGSSLAVNYMLFQGAAAVGAFAGTGTALDFGLQTVAGAYTVVGTSSVTGCSVSMSGSAAITITPSLVPSVTVHVLPGDTVCAGASVTFSATVTNGGSAPCLWSVNGSPVAVTPGYTFIPADGDVVSLKITSTLLCATPATVSGNVHMHVNAFVNPFVGLEVTPRDTVCEGTAVSVHALGGYAGAAPLYTWIKNGAPVSAGTSGDFYNWAPADGDAIYCVMNSSYPCRLSNSDTSSPLIVTVDAPVNPVVTITASPGTTIGPGQPDTLTAIVTNATAPSYQWYINGVPVPAATTAVFISSSFSYPGQDSVSCTVTSNGVCPVSGHQWVYINESSVGVHGIKTATDIQVIPNPNKGDFAVRGILSTGAGEEISIDITDMLGQQIYHRNVRTRGGVLEEKISLGNIAAGVYMVTVRSNEERKEFHVVVE